MDRQTPKSNLIGIEVIGQNKGLCKTGIPFPASKVTSLDQLKLYKNGNNVDASARPLCYWQDGSLKWISLSFFHSSENTNQYELGISNLSSSTQTDESSLKPHNGLQLDSNEEKITLSTTKFQFEIDLKAFSLSALSSHEQKKIFQIESLGGTLSLSSNQQATAKLKQWHSRTSHNLNTGLIDGVELEFEGHFKYQANKQPLRFTTLIEFYHTTPLIKVQTTLHNPNPAKHPNGLWDLGDEGSELFSSFVFDLTLPEEDKIKYQTSPDSEWQSAESSTKIIQRASGGSNWQSPVHVDKNNRIPLSTNGFEISVNQTTIDSGERATPILYSTSGINLTIEKFWQNFPSAIQINDSNIQLGLFPAITDSSYELQGGEKKTHTFWLNLSNQTNNMNWVHSPATVKPANDWLAECAALPTFSPTNETNPIGALIKTGLEHKQSFFAKREMIDEYGWRNFGDLYADHETAGYQGEELFISHYNNQYDPIYGFLRQFLLTGDARWFELADDLAKHVKDIDIYHTIDDKAEYNGGLFWHTDHYLKACTATHRSFSKLQESGAYEDHAGGGGPGGQHCYTTGLAYHYLLTGAEDSKQAVLTLANWISHFYEGTDTCLELLLAVKNRNQPGLKNQLNGQYPFDRGTANYVVALLDSYQLTQESDFLTRVEHIIRNTVHPEDNIAERNLSDVEERWFYTVFLQAICRYLQIKESTNSFDDAFYYARDALLHYADWMLSHEYPYLDKPETLEFPNDAWTAQEPRKTHIFATAFYYSPDNKQAYLDKAKYFQEYVATRLSTSIEASYTRTLVLLMQNHGTLQYYASLQRTAGGTKRRQSWPKASYHQTSGLAISLVKMMSKRLLKLSLANEISWLKMRLGK